MLRLNGSLLLLPTNEIVHGTIGISSDLLYQHTFSSWVQFLESGRIRNVNLGILAAWEDEKIVERIVIEDRARKIFNTQVEARAVAERDYFLVTVDIINRTIDTLDKQDYYFFDYFQKQGFLCAGKTFLSSSYYGGFVNNMFGVPHHFARQTGRNYYFVQEHNSAVIVPNIVSLEHSESIIDGWVQKLNSAKSELWQKYRRYVKETFGVNILYGKPEPKSNFSRQFSTKWRAKRTTR